MEVKCSRCGQAIATENINVAKDTAFCIPCNKLTALSSLLENNTRVRASTVAPVSGTTLTNSGRNWMITASHRSWLALFLIPFTLVWSGGSLGGIYGTQILTGNFNLFSSLFGLPFLIASIGLICMCLMSLFGRTLIAVENNKAPDRV